MESVCISVNIATNHDVATRQNILKWMKVPDGEYNITIRRKKPSQNLKKKLKQQTLNFKPSGKLYHPEKESMMIMEQRLMRSDEYDDDIGLVFNVLPETDSSSEDTEVNDSFVENKYPLRKSDDECSVKQLMLEDPMLEHQEKNTAQSTRVHLLLQNSDTPKIDDMIDSEASPFSLQVVEEKDGEEKNEELALAQSIPSDPSYLHISNTTDTDMDFRFSGEHAEGVRRMYVEHIGYVSSFKDSKIWDSDAKTYSGTSSTEAENSYYEDCPNLFVSDSSNSTLSGLHEWRKKGDSGLLGRDMYDGKKKN